ncbi:Plasmodium exported protein, unknown function [Plasmodium ovale]|uniref:Unspecified product n=2 Tax=Plasmodium ovale TaxID=36330 RepID=A0A1A8W8A9_PLAOA|nr:unspecified product [Plasmodium ovale curtisi]SBT02810.1 unspecified product [Plasmodium ovale curtisi]SBT85126.1 Plasmodium exported protein, unknown function [Plasmodium ovale]
MMEKKSHFLFAKTFAFSLLIWACKFSYEPTLYGESWNKNRKIPNALGSRPNRLLRVETKADVRQKQSNLKETVRDLLEQEDDETLQERLNALIHDANFQNTVDESTNNDNFDKKTNSSKYGNNFNKASDPSTFSDHSEELLNGLNQFEFFKKGVDGLKADDRLNKKLKKMPKGAHKHKKRSKNFVDKLKHNDKIETRFIKSEDDEFFGKRYNKYKRPDNFHNRLLKLKNLYNAKKKYKLKPKSHVYYADQDEDYIGHDDDDVDNVDSDDQYDDYDYLDEEENENEDEVDNVDDAIDGDDDYYYVNDDEEEPIHVVEYSNGKKIKFKVKKQNEPPKVKRNDDVDESHEIGINKYLKKLDSKFESEIFSTMKHNTHKNSQRYKRKNIWGKLVYLLNKYKIFFPPILNLVALIILYATGIENITTFGVLAFTLASMLIYYLYKIRKVKKFNERFRKINRRKKLFKNMAS